MGQMLDIKLLVQHCRCQNILWCSLPSSRQMVAMSLS